jgi:hypothetical protein
MRIVRIMVASNNEMTFLQRSADLPSVSAQNPTNEACWGKGEEGVFGARGFWGGGYWQMPL